MSGFARLRRALHDGSALQLMLALVVLCGITFGAAPAYAKKVHKIPRTPVVVTPSGKLRGVINGDIAEFLGIPYAAPPVGSARWTPPQPFGKWHGTFAASAFGSECTQGGNNDSEDCLFLNVYVPHFNKNGHKHRHGGLPVMFWIHGGGLTSGAGSDYDPTPLVDSGVIVVTINYRLGLLGFFAQSAIDAEGHENGNYGLMDQQFAMTWVQSNIANFGGDPGNVTIFGESAGGHSVYCQLGLAHRGGALRACDRGKRLLPHLRAVSPGHHSARDRRDGLATPWSPPAPRSPTVSDAPIRPRPACAPFPTLTWSPSRQAPCMPSLTVRC